MELIKLYYKLSFIANFMKRNWEGSILIWSIFLVIYISFSFLYISNWISKNLDKNKQKISSLQSNSMLDNFNFDSKSFTLLNNERWENKFFGSFESNLKKDETMIFSFLPWNTGSIIIQDGGPIFYKVYTGSTMYSSWLIIDQTYDIPFHSNSDLSIENLWWLSKISLEFDSNIWITYPYNYLNIKKNIWWSEFIKKVIEIK